MARRISTILRLAANHRLRDGLGGVGNTYSCHAVEDEEGEVNLSTGKSAPTTPAARFYWDVLRTPRARSGGGFSMHPPTAQAQRFMMLHFAALLAKDERV